MIPILNKNLVLHHGKLGKWTFYEILDFLDLSGQNILHLRNEQIKDSRFCHHFEEESQLENLIAENKFRVNLIVIEYTSYTKSQYTIDYHHETLFRRFKLPIIWCMPHLRTTALDIQKFDTCYRVDKNPAAIFNLYEDQNKYEHMTVDDLKNNETYTLENLRIQYVREKKLDDLLGL